MKTRKNAIIATVAAGLLLGAVPIASAQLGAGGDAPQEIQAVRGPESGRSLRGPRSGAPGGSLRAPIGRNLPLGTTVQVSFYGADPAEGAEATATLSFTVGEDSEVAFADELATAREGAAFMVIETGERTRAIDLPDADAAADALDAAPRRDGIALPLRGLETGDTVTAVFYDGDPEAGGNELRTLSFTLGEDSEAGFRNQVAEAAQEADWVVLTQPPQERTVDLSAAHERPERRAGPGGRAGRR